MGKWPPSQSWRPTSTTPCPPYRDQSHPFLDAQRPIYRNVGLEKFDGKMDEWENWAHQFRVFTQLYNWTDNEQLIHLVSSLRGPALTAHRNFSEAECATVEACMHTPDMRYSSKRSLTIASLRADLSVAKQEEGEGVGTFGDRLWGLTRSAYPGMAPDWIQGLSVPAFLKGLNDMVSDQEALKFGKPQTITDAIEQVMHLQCTARTFGGHRPITRHVVLNDDVPDATPQNTEDIDRMVDSVVRQLKQVGLSPNETPQSDTCFTCGGAGHRSRDCATKRRRSPSPLTCYACAGLGHLSRECSNTLERRWGSVKPSRRHRRRRRSTGSSDSVSSSSQEDTHQYHR